jgi:FSR family fosmidomycin resistance protein-like MFS transporter
MQERFMTEPRHAPAPAGRTLHRLAVFSLSLLVVEFLDEFVFGAREAAWPLIRDDLGLSYAQVGLLLGLPNIVANLIEPALGILGDVWKRRVLILGGGVVFALALALTAGSNTFLLLLAAFILFSPASGAFVGLAQATLMDLDPARHEQSMARWTFAGSVGVVAGPLALGAAAALGLGWRGLFAAFAVLTGVVLLIVWRQRFPPSHSEATAATFRAGLANAVAALRRREVLRWLTLLEFSDLMLDVLLGYLALYMVDVVHVSEAEAGVAVAVWTGVGLAGDLLLIPLLERVAGLRYLRISALIELLLFPAFLLVPGYLPKLLLLGLLGFFNAGWYAILKGRLYSTMPGQSGTVMAVGNVFGLVGGLIPLVVGLVAQQVGLSVTMWALLLGPIALLVGLPRADRAPGESLS